MHEGVFRDSDIEVAVWVGRWTPGVDHDVPYEVLACCG